MSTKPFFKHTPPPDAPKIENSIGLTQQEYKLSEEKWNFYRCSTCHAFWVTVDVAEGATPLRISCKDRPVVVDGKAGRLGDCKGSMASAFYPNPADWPKIVHRTADAEWYAPLRSEKLHLKKKNPRMFRYVLDGGLLMRPATVAHVFPIPQTDNAEKAEEGSEDAGE